LRDNLIAVLPERKRARAVPRRALQWLVLYDARGRVLLERRPERGIWGGLWSLPECAHDADVRALAKTAFGMRVGVPRALPPVRHRFTHFELTATPHVLRVVAKPARLPENTRWTAACDVAELGLPKPVRALLEQLWETAAWRA
jgi:A/G-specific adenine glycosylase